MVDENEREEVKGGEMPEETSQPAGAEPAGGAEEQKVPETPAEEGITPEAEAVQSSDGGTVKPQGGGIRRWYAGHKILTGVGIGVLTVALIVGVFFIGYAVGKPCNEPDRRVPMQQFQQPMQQDMQPDMQTMPLPDPGGDGYGRLDVLIEYRVEIEDVAAAELGISGDELRDEIEDGKTIAEIAEEKGVSSEELTAAVAAEIGRIADELAADGEITDAQAENMKDQADVLAERFVERGSRRFPKPSE